MKSLFLITLSMFSTIVYAVDFDKLSRTEPVTTVYQANLTSIVDVSLYVNALKAKPSNVFVKVSFIIGNDTLTDHISINGSHNAVIKQISLKEGERLTALVYLNNTKQETISGLEGSIRIVQNPKLEPSEDKGKSTFPSSIWHTEQMPLFRVGIKESLPRTFRLKLTVNENYDFDKLFINLKVVSKTAGIMMLKKEVVINEKESVDFRKKTFSIEIPEIDLTVLETYYIQVIQNMKCTRLNGIEKVEYELATQ